MLKRQCGVRRLANARTTRSSFRSNSTDVSSVKTDETAPLKLTADLKHSLKESSANLQEDSQLPADSIRPLLKSQRRKLLRKLKKLSAEPQGRDAPDSPSAPNSNNETIPENIEKASQDSASDSAGWAPEPWGMITNHCVYFCSIFFTMMLSLTTVRSFKSSEDSTSPIIGKQSKRIKYAGKYKSDMKDYEGTPTRFTTKHADSELPPSAVLSGIPRLPLPHSRSCEGLLEPSKELFTLKGESIHPSQYCHCRLTGFPTASDVEPPSEHRPVATLAHGLDRVLFKYGFICVSICLTFDPIPTWCL